MSRVLFSGTVVSNGGDRAIVEAQVALLRKVIPDIKIDFADNAVETARRLLVDQTVVTPAFALIARRGSASRFGRLLNRLEPQRVLAAAWLYVRGLHSLSRLICNSQELDLIQRMRGYDGVVYCGGTSLVESYWLQPKFFELDLARVCRVPISLMTQSMGPFEASRNARAMRRLARVARLILLRDAKSLGHLESIGARTDRSEVLPDIVFSLASEGGVRNLVVRLLPPRGLKIVISVRELDNYKDYALAGTRDRYLSAIRSLVHTAVTKWDADVTFLSTCQGIPGYWTDDAAVAADVVGLLDPAITARVRVDDQYHSTSSLIDQYSSADLVIATRLHAAILALVAGSIVLPIAYEFKTHTVFEGLGFGDRVLDVATVDADSLICAVEDLCRDADALRPGLAVAVESTSSAASRAGWATSKALGLTAD